jgi:DNA helicase HerA-like ATPase
MAERFSEIGVPVFMSDIKGDLSGVLKPGTPGEKIQARIAQLGIADHAFQGYPVRFWDIFGASGHPIRTTVSEIGPLLFARLLDLNDIQSATLSVIFKVADENGLLLLDLKDLRAITQYAGEHADEIAKQYGLVSSTTIGAIQRALLTFEEQGGSKLLGEPAINLSDFIQTSPDGKGVINVLAAEKLILRRRSIRPSFCGCSPSFSKRFPKSETSTSPSWCSSSTRRTCS